MSRGDPSPEPINLALNESPFGASPKAIDAARASVGQAGRYADVRYAGQAYELTVLVDDVTT